MRDGFVITKANGKAVRSVDELRQAIGALKEIKVEGIYPGYEEPFEYPLILDESGN
jgi:S1-C subfamily serine protease